MNCIACDGTSYTETAGATLFGLAYRYADYIYRVCLDCGLAIGRLSWVAPC